MMANLSLGEPIRRGDLFSFLALKQRILLYHGNWYLKHRNFLLHKSNTFFVHWKSPRHRSAYPIMVIFQGLLAFASLVLNNFVIYLFWKFSRYHCLIVLMLRWPVLWRSSRHKWFYTQRVLNLCLTTITCQRFDLYRNIFLGIVCVVD